MSWLEGYLSTYRGLPPRVWILAVVCLVNRVGSMVITFLSLYVSNHLGADVETVGRVLTAHGAGAVVGVIAGGALVDRLGPKRIMVASLTSNAIGFVLISRIPDVDWLMVAMFVLAAFGEAVRPANTAALAGAARPEDMGRAFGLMQLAVNLGVSIGAGVGGFLAAISYPALFYVDAAAAFAGAVLTLLYVKEGTAAPRAAREKSEARRPSGVALLIGGQVVVSALLIQMFTTAPLYHNVVNGFSERRIGLLVVVNTLIITFSQVPAAARLASMPTLRVIAGGLVGFAGGYLLLPFTSAYAMAVTAMTIFTLGELVIFPALNTHVAKAAPPGETGRYMGMTFAAHAGGRLVAPFVGTLVYQRLGPLYLWWGCAVVGLLLALAYVLAENRDRRSGQSAHLGHATEE
ncbi:MAG TPA: MFS transporter [Myxococcota bacterium]|nr:MFS transporter [Myxococcota bacterium]